MKQFLLFAWHRHEHFGGWTDFVNDFGTQQEAYEYWKSGTEYWCQIVDCNTKKIVQEDRRVYAGDC